MEDFEVSADGTLVAPGTMRSRRGGAEQGRKAARDAEKEKRKAEKSAARRRDVDGSKKKGSGIKCLPLVMLFVVIGPAVFPVLMQAMELVGNSAVGLAAYDSCIQVGLCSTYRDQLIAVYKEFNPKKVKQVSKLLAKWKGKEARLIKEVRGKYEQKRRLDQIRKAAMERDKQEQSRTSEDSRGSRSSSDKAKRARRSQPSPPKQSASGWSDEEESPPEMWDDEEPLDDIMG